jgi:hypothetical protein
MLFLVTRPKAGLSARNQTVRIRLPPAASQASSGGALARSPPQRGWHIIRRAVSTRRFLQNRIHRGEIVHKERSYPGEHTPIQSGAVGYGDDILIFMAHSAI